MHGTQAVQFTDVILGRIIENWYGILLLALPVIAFIVFRKKLDFHKIKSKMLQNLDLETLKIKASIKEEKAEMIPLSSLFDLKNGVASSEVKRISKALVK